MPFQAYIVNSPPIFPQRDLLPFAEVTVHWGIQSMDSPLVYFSGPQLLLWLECINGVNILHSPFTLVPG